MEFAHIEDIFVNIGGHFYTSAFKIQEQLKNIQAYVFDWDGVFNDGRKGIENSSSFSEVDSMGVSMLRFGHFLRHKMHAKTAVITGEANPACTNWASREGFDAVYLNTKRKDKALEHFCKAHDLAPENVAYFFDDILDVPVAAKAGIRLAVGRPSNPVFREYLEKKKLVDYISGSTGETHAVREHCELLLMLFEKEFEVIDRRSAYDDFYTDYIQLRNEIPTQLYQYDEGSFRISN